MDQQAAVRIAMLGAGDVSIVVVGSLVGGRLGAAAGRLHQLAILGFECITVDVSATGRIDDSGASMLREFITDTVKCGGHVRLVDVTGQVADLGLWIAAHERAGSGADARHAA